MDEKLFLHFELIPDHLPDRLKKLLVRFPSHSLQFEIGVQTFNPVTQQLISRKQDDQKTEENLRWLRTQTHAHIHADLIVGLPGEDMNCFAAGLNRLVQLEPHEIQIGILKRLRGSPIIRHTEAYQLRFNPNSPYNILSNHLVDFGTMQRLNRFARYWDMIINSGRFKHGKQIILDDDPFQRFMQLSDWLYGKTGQTHKIALRRLFELLYEALIDVLAVDEALVVESLLKDYRLTGLKGIAPFRPPQKLTNILVNGRASRRQQRHP